MQEPEKLRFTILSKDASSHARRASLELEHGTIETPAFMPVGTNATVKSMLPEHVAEIGYGLILSNTYHLYLRPGIETISRFDGLHRFMNWKGNILTDSGGYQVFSLAPFRKIREEGIRFRSHIDGAYHNLTPEQVVDLQRAFGSDILMPLDVCSPCGITHKEAQKALHQTHRWAKRSLDAHRAGIQRGALFGIVQGNFFHDLRRESVEYLSALDFPGLAIGGLSVGEPYEQFREFIQATGPLLPADKPRYLMGVGTPEYILDAVASGMDMFDCVFPTRIARNGTVFTRTGRLVLKKEENRLSEDPIDAACSCMVCRNYSRAYLRHVVKSNEIIAATLATTHNLAFMFDLMRDIRESIGQGQFSAFSADFLARYGGETKL